MSAPLVPVIVGVRPPHVVVPGTVLDVDVLVEVDVLVLVEVDVLELVEVEVLLLVELEVLLLVEVEVLLVVELDVLDEVDVELEEVGEPPVVWMSTHHPPRKSLAACGMSSTTQRFHVPLGLMPLNAARVAECGVGAGEGQ